MLHEHIDKPELLFAPEQVANIKRHFDRDPSLRKINRGSTTKLGNEQVQILDKVYRDDEQAVDISYSIVKMEDGRMFAMQDKLGEGEFGSVRKAQDIETGQWYALKIQKMDLTDPFKGSKVRDIEKEEALHKRIERLESRQVRLSLRETDRGKEHTIKFYTVMPLYEATEAAKLTNEINTEYSKLLSLFTEYKVENDEIVGIKHIAFTDLSDEQQLQIVDFIISRLNFGRTLAHELATLHELDIIHRDLWLGNVLVDKDSSATIIDFGKAGYVDEHTKTLKGVLADGRILSPESIKALHLATKKYGKGKEGGAKYVFTPQEDLYALGDDLRLFKVSEAIIMLHENLKWIPKEESTRLLNLLKDLTKKSTQLPHGRPSAESVAKELDKVYDLIIKKRQESGLSSSLSDKSASSSSPEKSSSETMSSSSSDSSPARSVGTPERMPPSAFPSVLQRSASDLTNHKRKAFTVHHDTKKEESKSGANKTKPHHTKHHHKTKRHKS